MTASAPKGFVIEALNKQHNRGDFSCGVDVLDNYLKKNSRQDRRKNLAATFVLVDETQNNAVAGYYTLSAFAFDQQELPSKVSQKLPHYRLISATLLGRLAVAQKYQGKNLGKALLFDALKRSYRQSQQIASYAVVVDAKDEAAVQFYKRHGFLLFEERPNRLYLAMGTIAQLIPI